MHINTPNIHQIDRIRSFVIFRVISGPNDHIEHIYYIDTIPHSSYTII